MTSTSIDCRYPFSGKDLKEIKDPQVYYSALSGMSGGFFPLGANGFPHGGVHFGDATATKLDQATGIRCILDGEVVAYRLDKSYPHLNYSNGKKAAYSTSFVLVRHSLTLPPATTGNGTAAPAATDVHDVYSLYMHLASWMEYLADGALKRPAYWNGISAYRVGKIDQQVSPSDGPQGWGALGSFVSSEPKDGKAGKAGKHIGFLPEGSEVLIEETRGKWGHIKQIVSGGMISPVAGGAFGSDDMNVPWEIPEWRAKDKRSATTAQGDWGWLYLPDQKLVIEPDPKYLDDVVVLDKPYPVKAGSFLGHIGEYQRFREGSPLPPTPRRALLHLEVFAGDSFASFLKTCRDRAAQLPDAQRTLFVVSPGTQLVAGEIASDQVLAAGLRIELVANGPAKGRWAKVRTRKPDPHAKGGFGAPSATAIWIERSTLGSPSAGLPAWTRFPLRTADIKEPATGFSLVLARAQLDGLDERSKATDDQGVQWWRISLGTKTGESKFGWVCEKGHPGTQWESPWAWPGFSMVDATGISAVDCFKRNLSVLGATDFTEQQEFKPSATSVNNSELMLALEQAIDAQGNKDGKVNAAELQNALKKPWLAQSLSHLILRYESEWGGSMSRWETLTPLMKESKKTWVGELERIKRLQWWNPVANKVAGFPKSPAVFHIHPIGLVGNFSCGCGCININAFLDGYESEHVSFEPGTHPLDPVSRENLKVFVQYLIEYYQIYKDNKCNIPYMAYILATARLETKKLNKKLKQYIFFAPTTEGGDVAYFNKYDPVLAETAHHRQRAVRYGNTQQGDGYKYRGRGYVQVTWKLNYKSVGDYIGQDLVTNPDLGLNPRIAAFAAVYGMEKGIFTGRKLSSYITDQAQDYLHAREIINGSDQAALIASFAVRFKALLERTKC